MDFLARFDEAKPRSLWYSVHQPAALPDAIWLCRDKVHLNTGRRFEWRDTKWV